MALSANMNVMLRTARRAGRLLVKVFGEASSAPIGLRIWRTYPPFEQMLDTGLVIMDRDDDRLDQNLEKELGTRDEFAAIAVSDGQYVLSFDVDSPADTNEELPGTLNIIRLAINQKLREERGLCYTVFAQAGAFADGAALYTSKICVTCHGADGAAPISAARSASMPAICTKVVAWE